MNLHKTLQSLGLDLLPPGDGPVQVRPRSVDETRRVVRACRDLGVRVRPMGLDGGDTDASVLVDLSRFDGVQLHDESHLVTAGAGVPLDELERRVRAEGFTLGLEGGSAQPLGAWLSGAEPGPLCARTRPATSPVASVEAVALDGTHLTTRLAPRRSAGPALEALLVGGQGRTGIIVGATLRMHRRGALTRRLVYAFPAYTAGLDAAVEALGRDLVPDRFGLVDGGVGETVLTWEAHGEPRTVGLQATVLDEACTAAGGRRLATQARTGAQPDPEADPGAAGPVQVAAEAARRRPEDARLEIAVRWSRVVLVRRALLGAAGASARLDLLRALPEGAAGLVSVPADAVETARKAIGEAGGHVRGDGVHPGWYAAVGAVIEGGKA